LAVDHSDDSITHAVLPSGLAYPMVLKFADAVAILASSDDEMPERSEALCEYDLASRALFRVDAADCLFFDAAGAAELERAVAADNPLALAARGSDQSRDPPTVRRSSFAFGAGVIFGSDGGE
jgi:hypothetical protein